MVKQLYNFITLLLILLVICSCNNKINQKSMFKGRDHVNKRGIYDVGMNRNETYKTPPSVQISEDANKASKKYDVNTEKELLKKKKKAARKRNKINRKRRVKVKTTKGKTTGGK